MSVTSAGAPNGSSPRAAGFWPRRIGADVLDELVAQLRSVRPSGRDWTAATGFTLLNWAFDAGCLASCAAALNVPGLTPPLLLIAYTAGMASSGLSLVPAGSVWWRRLLSSLWSRVEFPPRRRCPRCCTG